MIKSLRNIGKLALFSIWLLPALSSAQSEDFQAEFKAKLMGISVGTVKQSMHCENQLCTLTNKAIPPRWAHFFINESSVETIQLRYHPERIEWLHYHKDLERRYSDRTKHIDVDMRADLENNKIISVQEEMSWPYNPNAYDMISLVYALRFYAQKGGDIPSLILQEEREQNPIHFRVKNKKTKAHTGFKSDMAARYFEWDTERHRIKIWLMEELDLFPGRIDFYNKEHDRRVLLVLNRPPKFN